jgi:hypothetical protein
LNIKVIIKLPNCNRQLAVEGSDLAAVSKCTSNGNSCLYDTQECVSGWINFFKEPGLCKDLIKV